MSETAITEEARGLVEQGLREAAAIPHPVLRARHHAAWLFRLSAVDPAAAAEHEADLAEDPTQRAQLLLTATADRLHQEATDLDPFFGRTLELARDLDPDTRLRILNSLSELAIELADRDREAGTALLGRLIPEAEALTLPDAPHQQYQVLALALVGEGLMVMGDERGAELLRRAEERSADLPAREPVTVFLASAWSKRDPERSVSLLETLEDPGARMECGMQLLPHLPDDASRNRVLELIMPAVCQIAHWQGPEPLVMLGQVVAAWDGAQARALFDEALSSSPGNPPQLRALQATGVATAVAASDREWSAQLFSEAADLAGQEAEGGKRATTLALIAGEMAEHFPREAAEVFAQAMAEAVKLETMWELAHVMDIVFRSDRSEYLDIAPARPLLDRMLDQISDEDPRIPGVMGVAEVARSMQEIDPERARELFQRWFHAAEAGEDADGMGLAALDLYRNDREAGLQALRATHAYLIRRVDCPSMGEFCRRAGGIAPDLVLSMAPHIPDRRERSDAFAEAAVGEYRVDPATGLELLNQLERPVDRSSTLLRIVDGKLQTSGRPQPQPLLEDMP